LQAPSAPNVPVYYLPPTSNGLGLAGFVVSLVGLLSLGILCPIGLILSLFALAKRPRGFAVAGVILGLLGSCGGIIAVVAIVGAVAAAITLGSMAYVALNDPEHLEVSTDLSEIGQAVERARTPEGYPPAALTTLRLDSDILLDPWGRPYEYHLVTEQPGYEVTSWGPDGKAGTDDDIALSKLDELWENYLQVNQTSTKDGGTMEIKVGSKTVTLIGGPDSGIVRVNTGDRVIELIGGQGKGKVRMRSISDVEAEEAAASQPDAEATSQPSTMPVEAP
jgi:hypothetical protein